MKILKRTTVIIGLAAVVASCGPKPPPETPITPEEPVITTEARLEVARAFMDRGRVGEAADHYRQILEEDPQSFEANLNLGIALATMEDAKFENERDYTAARLPLLAARAARPEDARPYIHIGALDFKSRAYRAAIENLSVAIRLDPRSEQAHEMLGVSYLELGMDKAAREELEATLGLNPANETANFEVGKIYESQGSNRLAMVHLEQALQANPNLDMATWLLERIYYEEGLFDRAEAACGRFLRFHPEDIQSLEILGWIYKRQERTSDMLEIYTRLTDIEPDNTGYWSPLVQHYMERNDYENARPILEQSLQHNPYYAYGNVRYGQVLMHYADERLRDGRTQEGLQLLSEALGHLDRARVDDRYHTTALELIERVRSRIRTTSGR
jgi:tetratricopeptide (TPR) repeat protein